MTRFSRRFCRARPLRIQRIGCWYHVTARGNEQRQIFVDDKDRRHFLELLESTVGMFGLRVHAFVLMSNHYHLLVEITELNLSRSVQWLNSSYSVWFNRRHRRSGHLLVARAVQVGGGGTGKLGIGGQPLPASECCPVAPVGSWQRASAAESLGRR